MDGLRQLIGIRSQAASEVGRFYRRMEAECNRAPWGWRDGRGFQASDFFIEQRLLTEKLPQPRRLAQPPDAPSVPLPKRGILQRFFGRGPVQHDIKAGTMDEIAAERYEFPLRPETRRVENWRQVFDGQGLRLLFTGGAGSGKSFSLGQEVRQRLARSLGVWESMSRPFHDLEIAVIVTANALAETPGANIADALLSLLPGLKTPVSARLQDWWRRAFEFQQGRRLFIVIDGLDELRDTRGEQFRQRMQQLDELREASLVVACRTVALAEKRSWLGWAEDSRVRTVELAPLETAQQHELIKKFSRLSQQPPESLEKLLETNFAVRHFCRTPLLLTFACLLHAEGVLSANITYASLYENIAKRLLRAAWRELRLRPAWTQAETVVERDQAERERINLFAAVSWELFAASSSENFFTLPQWQAAARRAIAQGCHTSLDATALLSELERSGLVIDAGYLANQAGQWEQHYSFMHRTLLEYFAARGLLEQHDEPFWVETLAGHIWCEAAWVEVIRFAASLAPDPTKLLHRVAQESGDSRSLKFIRQVFGLPEDLPQIFFSGIGALGLLGIAIWKGITPMPADVLRILLFLLATGLLMSLIGWRDSLLANFGAFLSNSLLWWVLLIGAANAKGITTLTMLDKWGNDLAYLDVFSLIVALMVAYWLTRSLATMPVEMLSGLTLRVLTGFGMLKQDDMFQTGLRIRTEVIGLNFQARKKDIEGVAHSLLSWQNYSTYGSLLDHHTNNSTSVLLCFGNNPQARQALCDEWLNRIEEGCECLQSELRYRSFAATHTRLRWFVPPLLLWRRTRYRSEEGRTALTNACWGLSILQDKRAIGGLLEILKLAETVLSIEHLRDLGNYADMEFQIEIPAALARLGHQEGEQTLISLASKDGLVSDLAAERLRLIRGGEAEVTPNKPAYEELDSTLLGATEGDLLERLEEMKRNAFIWFVRGFWGFWVPRFLGGSGKEFWSDYNWDEYDRLLLALGKIDSETALQVLQREARHGSCVAYYLAAKMLVERDDSKALKMLLKGQFAEGWWHHYKYGDAPSLWHYAWHFGARIIKIGGWQYVAVSPSRGFRHYIMQLSFPSHRRRSNWRWFLYGLLKVVKDYLRQLKQT